MGVFAGLKDAKISETGSYLTDGTYKLRVERIVYKQTRSKGYAYIAEFNVLESSNPEHPVGSKRTWFQSMNDKEIAFPAIQKFAAAALGVNPFRDKELFEKEILPNIEELVENSISDAGDIFKGKDVNCEVEQVKTKKGGDFSRYDFSAA